MNNIKILADSTCDLSPELISKYNIGIIPLCIVLDDKSYYDGLEITPDEIYTWSDEHKTTPKTAAASFDKTLDSLKPFMRNGDDIIFFGISSQMSTTCNVVRLTGEEEDYGRLFVIDSQNLSTGIGLQIIKAAEMAAAGKSADEIVEEIENARSRVRASFVVDNLTFLARGGRCSTITAVMANTLRLHPLITVTDGAMGAGKKYRGKMDVAILDYVNDLMPQLQNAEPERVFITHSGCEAEIIDAVHQKLEEMNYFKEILITRAGGVISSHCGPNTLGVLFYEK
ncbi:MAG: DegV family protein [Ruminococcaceae bacterium]|nr:DegV family protein [Oscillospiraceae bacterium]